MNAAGITHYSPLFVTGVESLGEIVQTNLVGTMLACRMVGKGMLGKGGMSYLGGEEWTRTADLGI